MCEDPICFAEREVVNHIDPSLSYTRRFIYHNEDIVLELDERNRPVAGYLHGQGIDEPIAMVRDVNKNESFESNEVFYYTLDHLGSVRELVNFEAEVVQKYDYTSYGETKLADRDGRRANKFVENRYAYTSRELEKETGDYYYRARYYNPSTGRFLSEDPIGFKAGDTNLYRYVKNNPINDKDPDGKISVLTAISLFCAASSVGNFLAVKFAFDSAIAQGEAFDKRISELRAESNTCTSDKRKELIKNEIRILEREKLNVLNDADTAQTFLDAGTIGAFSAFCAVTSASRL